MRSFLLFAHLLLFVTGALLYGFLARELFRHRRVLPGLPMRLTVICLTVWYGGCLVDQVAQHARSPRRRRSDGRLRRSTSCAASPGSPASRSSRTASGACWSWKGRGSRPSRLWLVPGYATLPLFAPAAARAWRERLVPAGRGGEVGLPPDRAPRRRRLLWPAPGWCRAGCGIAREPRLEQFLRWLLAGLGITLALIAAGGLLRLRAGWGEALWRLAVESSGLVLGLTFLYFVQRYNLLRLSMSFRSLRRFLGLARPGRAGDAGRRGHGRRRHGGVPAHRRLGDPGRAPRRRGLYAGPAGRSPPLRLAAPPAGGEHHRRGAGAAHPPAPVLRSRRGPDARADRPRDRPVARHPGPLPAVGGRAGRALGALRRAPRPTPSTGSTRRRPGSPPCCSGPTSRPPSRCGWGAS